MGNAYLEIDKADVLDDRLIGAQILCQRFGERVTVRVSAGAAPLWLLAQAQRAATSKDVRARVTVAGEASRSVSLWDESRVWDPGD